MSASNSRKRSMGKNCSFVEEVAEIEEHNDIRRILDEIQQLDINAGDKSSRLANEYECLVCFFKTTKLIEWKCHIMSISHLADCHKMNDLYSHLCTFKRCKKLLYGPKKLLEKHISSHQNNNMKTVNNMSICMASVLKRFKAKESETLFYCSDCKVNGSNNIHKKRGKKCPRKNNYHCKFCNFTFYTDSDGHHSLSVEHMTIKCFVELLSKAKNTSKRIKRTESSDKSKEYRTSEISLNDEDVLITNGNTQITKPFENIKVNKREENLGTTVTSLDSSDMKKEYVPTTTSVYNVIEKQTSTIDNAYEEPKQKDGSTSANFSSSLTLRSTSTNHTKFNINKDNDEDKSYGDYVFQRLRNLDSSLKQSIKLEIDNIFYMHRKPLQ